MAITNILARGTYNHPDRHYLQPVNGYSAMDKLNFVAPMSSEALTADNGSGTPMGMPAGSVMSLNNRGELIAGATGTSLPMFLLYNSWDPDAYAGYTTADMSEVTGISMNSAAKLTPDNTNSYNTPGVVDSEAAARVGAGYGLAVDWNSNPGTPQYTSVISSGNYTTWPATCGMELSTTEFDLSYLIFSDDDPLPREQFVPGTQLTAPAADSTAQAPSAPATTPDGVILWNAYYQKKRGGFVRPLTTAEKADTTTVNICGVVSKGLRVNEHGVPVVYFHACYCPARVTAAGG